MPKAYWMVRVSVRDEQRYPEYLAAAGTAFQKFGASFIVRGGKTGEYALDDVQGFARAQPTTGDEQLTQGRARHVLHRDVVEVTGRALVKYGHDVRVGEPGS